MSTTDGVTIQSAEFNAGDHAAHLFASPGHLAATVARFSCQGLERGDGLILLVSAENVAAIEHEIELGGFTPEELRASGDLLVEDAEELLAAVFNDREELDEHKFRGHLDGLIAAVRSAGRSGVRAYGELVLLLQRQSRFAAAERLEDAWNRIVDEQRIALLCGYDALGPGSESLPDELIAKHDHVYQESARERLLQAGRDLFSQGYEKTTTAAIARRAGSSGSQIANHFGNKEGLLLEIFELWWARLLQRIEASDDTALPPGPRVQMILRLALEAFHHDRRSGRILLFEGWRLQRAGHGPIISRGLLRFSRLLDGIFAEARERNQLAAGFSERTARLTLIGALDGLVRASLVVDYEKSADVPDLADVESALRAMSGNLFRSATSS